MVGCQEVAGEEVEVVEEVPVLQLVEELGELVQFHRSGQL